MAAIMTVTGNVGSVVFKRIIISTESFDREEALEIMSWDISDEQKIKLLGCTNESISIIDKKYSTSTNFYEFILQNNFDTSELPILIATYEEYPESTKEIIQKLVIQNISLAIEHSDNISINLLKALLSSTSLEIDQQIEIFIATLPELNKKECIEMLNVLNLLDFVKLLNDSGRPKFEVNMQNQKLLAGLKENDFISNFKVNDVQPSRFKVDKVKSR